MYTNIQYVLEMMNEKWEWEWEKMVNKYKN